MSENAWASARPWRSRKVMDGRWLESGSGSGCVRIALRKKRTAPRTMRPPFPWPGAPGAFPPAPERGSNPRSAGRIDAGKENPGCAGETIMTACGKGNERESFRIEAPRRRGGNACNFENPFGKSWREAAVRQASDSALRSDEAGMDPIDRWIPGVPMGQGKY